MIPFALQKNNNISDESSSILSTYRKITQSIAKPKILILLHLFENVPTKSITMPIAFEVLNQYNKTHWLFSIKAMETIIETWKLCDKLEPNAFVQCMTKFFVSNGNDVMIEETNNNKKFPQNRPGLYSFVRNISLDQESIDTIKKNC